MSHSEAVTHKVRNLLLVMCFEESLSFTIFFNYFGDNSYNCNSKVSIAIQKCNLNNLSILSYM